MGRIENLQIFTIFRTYFGFFGIISTEKGVFSSVLPEKVEQTCRDLLLSRAGGIRSDSNTISIGNAELVQDDEYFAETIGLVRAYYKGGCVDFSRVRVDFDRIQQDLGDKSGFAIDILKTLRKIKCGKVTTYGELAKQAGHNGASRAVGTVLSKNPLPLILPCHRVIRADGSIGRFSANGGEKTKKSMLELEVKANVATF